MSQSIDTNVLPYADEAQRYGVAIDRSAGGVRIYVPPAYTLRRLPRGYWISTGVLLALGLVSAIDVFRGRLKFSDVAIGFVQYFIAIVIVWMFAWGRLRRRYTFAVQNNRFAMTRARKKLPGTRTSWPLDSIEECRYNSLTNKLMLRIQGQDMFELFISPKKEVTQLVVYELNKALHDGTGRGVADTDEEEREAAEQVRRVRAKLLVTAAVIGAAELLLVAIFPILLLGWIYWLIPVCVPIGIALGTQEKEYWV